MGHVHAELPEEVHRAIKNIKNNAPDRPDTVEGCVVEAIGDYADRYGEE